MTINLSSNSMNDILAQTKRQEADKVRQTRKQNQEQKFIKRVEDTGWIDAIDYAPERNWTHLFAKTPISQTIDKSFIDKNATLKDSYDRLDETHNNQYNKFLKSSGNFLTSIALPSLIAGAALIPAANIAGMGYLAGWGINALSSGIATGTVGSALKMGRHFAFDKAEKETSDNFVSELKTHADANLTDMHKYYNAADKLSKLSLSEGEILRTLSRLYIEANKHLETNHNVNLADVYLSSDNKRNLKNYQKVENDAYIAEDLNKNMTSVPASLVETLPQEIVIDGATNAGASDDDLKNVVNLKIKALKDIGVEVNINELVKKPDGTNRNIIETNKKINDKYGAILDKALLVYQGKNSMAAPIVDKVEKLLTIALEAYYHKVSSLLKSKGLKNVPQMTSDFVEKILARIMLGMGATNDPKLFRILGALSDTTAFKVASKLNRYSPDSKQAKEQKELYGKASFDDVYAIKATEYNDALKDLATTFNPIKSSMKQLEAFKSQPTDKQKKIVYHQVAEKLSKETGKKIWVNPIGKNPTLMVHRDNFLGKCRIPYFGTKKYDDSGLQKEIQSKL